MYLRRMFGLDLAGRLRSYKARYRSDVRLFDYTTVWCHVSAWRNGTASATAAAYCSDPSATGLDMRPITRFYSSPSLPSVEEAEKHLSIELVRASTKFPETRFYRTIAEQEYVWSDSGWIATSETSTFERCRGCGFLTKDIICPKCGEPMF